jgi:Holliday junction resolvasome RuvABC endonuclease subunit
MKVIGIDISLTRTGLAVYHDTGLALTDVVTSKGKRDDTLRERAARIRSISAAVSEWYRPEYCDTALVVVEAPAFGLRGGSTWDRAGLWWHIVGRLHSACLPVAECNPITLKVWATNDRQADKAAVATSIARRTTVPLASSDAVDALALAMLGAHKLGWIDGPQYAVERLAKVKWPESMVVTP